MYGPIANPCVDSVAANPNARACPMCNDRPVALAEIVTFARPVTEPSLLVDAVHRAITTALRVPQNDPTVWHRSVAPGEAKVAARLGQHAVLVRVTLFEGRSQRTLSMLHAGITNNLSGAGIDRSGVLVVAAELPRSSWSVGGITQDTVDVGFDVEI